MKKLVLISCMLMLFFFSGVAFSIYNVKIVNVNNNLITIKILNNYIDYYYE